MNRIINLTSLEQQSQPTQTTTKNSFPKAMLQFYLILTAPLLSNLLSKQMKSLLTTNRVAQHLLGLLTMFVLISETTQVSNQAKTAIYTFVLYSWFILTTKLDLHWNLLIIGLLVVGYLYDSKMKNKEENATGDEAMTKADRVRLVYRHNRMRAVIFLSVLLITVIGTLFYVRKKGVQYGGGFDMYDYLIN